MRAALSLSAKLKADATKAASDPLTPPDIAKAAKHGLPPATSLICPTQPDRPSRRLSADRHAHRFSPPLPGGRIYSEARASGYRGRRLGIRHRICRTRPCGRTERECQPARDGYRMLFQHKRPDVESHPLSAVAKYAADGKRVN